MTNDAKQSTHTHSFWRNTRRLTLWLSTVWLLSTFCTIFFARELHQISVFGWPLSFYMAAQGILLIYVCIVGAYAWYMRRLEQAPSKDHEQ
jgi:putative solute:sodium symporter small subunit